MNIKIEPIKYIKLIIPTFFLITNACTENNIKIAFWNVENLFDLENDQLTNDDEFSIGGKKNMDERIFNKKITNLSEVIDSIDADIFALCEVENISVLETLNNSSKTRDYSIIHYDSKDLRGIDVALFYDQRKILFLESESIKIPMPNDKPTRDILLATFTKNNKKLFVFVNHWPSRYGGVKETNPLRKIAANTLRNKIDTILHVEPHADIVILGDLNDEPTDESIINELGATMYIDSLIKHNYALYNLMGKWHQSDLGATYKYGGKDLVYDHIIVSNGLLDNLGFKYLPESVSIFDGYKYRQHGGKYDGYPYRFWAGNKLLGGYSDHMPIYFTILLN